MTFIYGVVKIFPDGSEEVIEIFEEDFRGAEEFAEKEEAKPENEGCKFHVRITRA